MMLSLLGSLAMVVNRPKRYSVTSSAPGKMRVMSMRPTILQSLSQQQETDKFLYLTHSTDGQGLMVLHLDQTEKS